MSDSLAQALLRQICVSCDVRVTAVRKHDPAVGCEIWTLTAFKGKQQWVAKHEDRYKAACVLAEMVGFEGGGRVAIGALKGIQQRTC